MRELAPIVQMKAQPLISTPYSKTGAAGSSGLSLCCPLARRAPTWASCRMLFCRGKTCHAGRTCISPEGFAEQRWIKDRRCLTSLPRAPSARYRYPCVSLQPSTCFARLRYKLLHMHAEQTLYFLGCLSLYIVPEDLQASVHKTSGILRRQETRAGVVNSACQTNRLENSSGHHPIRH